MLKEGSSELERVGKAMVRPEISHSSSNGVDPLKINSGSISGRQKTSTGAGLIDRSLLFLTVSLIVITPRCLSNAADGHYNGF